jgi:D-glycero-D-manno-heptose 1,7-bisphosphate phosphatase
MRPEAVFLDRDGVINREIFDYIKQKEEFRLISRSADAIRLLNQKGILAIVISNQAGVAKGYYTEERVSEIHSLMEERLAKRGVYLDRIYYCPHHPEGIGAYRKECYCRKPRPGMLKEAEREFGISLKECWMVGDRMMDIETGAVAGCKTALVLTGYGKGVLKERESWKVEPDIIAKDLYNAVKKILEI